MILHYYPFQVVGNANAKGAASRDAEMADEDAEDDDEEDEEGSEGSADEEEDMEEDEEEEQEVENCEDFERTTQLHYLPTEEHIQANTVMDITEFCNQRPYFPVSKIVW